MRKARFFTAVVLTSITMPIFAFSCFYTAVKADCWLNYEVTIKILDVADNSLLATAVIPKGKLWARVPFTCNFAQQLNYSATFQPTIWQGQENKVYGVQHYLHLPASAKATEKAWNIPVCFPQAFAEVPIPPQATANCTCDFKSIPAVPLQP